MISPEGCASDPVALGRERPRRRQALRLTAQDLHRLGVCDTIVDEPLGGAHRNRDLMMQNLSAALDDALRAMGGVEERVLRAPARSSWPWAVAAWLDPVPAQGDAMNAVPELAVVVPSRTKPTTSCRW